MNDLEAYLWVVLGILLSIVVPFAVAVLQPPAKPQGLASTFGAWIIYLLKRYGKYGAASLVIGLLALTVARAMGMKLEHWYDAVLIGYAWDSTIEKVFKRNP